MGGDPRLGGGRNVSGGRVVVVGGGLAGLAAGIACADGGAAVTLLESRPRLGGATWSFRRDGRWYDNGQHVFLRCCNEYRAFLTRIGSTGGTHLQDRLSIPVLRPGKRPACIRRSRLPVPLHLARALACYGPLGAADRARLGRAALALSQLDLADPALDHVSFETWLGRHGQSPAAIAGLWDLITRPTVNLPASRASAAMAAKVFQTGLLSEAGAADIGWAKVPLAHLHGGPAGAALAAAGVDVRLRAKVTAVETGAGAGAGPATADPVGNYGAGLAVVADGERLQADSVVLAVPHEAAAELLPEGAVANQKRLGELGASPIVDVHLVYDRRVTDIELAAALDSPVQWVFDSTAASGHEGPGQVLAVSLSAADEWIGRRPEDLVATFVAAVAELFPRARSAQVLDSVVSRERAATFASFPGTAALRPAAQTAFPGLVVAGAWTHTGWPATMEGAVRSGNAAARVVLAGLARDRAPGTAVRPSGAAAVQPSGAAVVQPSGAAVVQPSGVAVRPEPTEVLG
ncbi:MAG: hydroxysqualene dehydroxylase HpnE [Acidimicrobiales bacterium]